MHGEAYGGVCTAFPPENTYITICRYFMCTYVHMYVRYMWQVLAPMRLKISDGSIECIARRCRRLHTFSFILGENTGARKAGKE